MMNLVLARTPLLLDFQIAAVLPTLPQGKVRTPASDLDVAVSTFPRQRPSL